MNGMRGPAGGRPVVPLRLWPDLSREVQALAGFVEVSRTFTRTHVLPWMLVLHSKHISDAPCPCSCHCSTARIRSRHLLKHRHGSALHIRTSPCSWPPCKCSLSNVVQSLVRRSARWQTPRVSRLLRRQVARLQLPATCTPKKQKNIDQMSRRTQMGIGHRTLTHMSRKV